MKLFTLALVATGLAAAMYKKKMGAQREPRAQAASGNGRTDRASADTSNSGTMPADDGSTEGGSWARRAGAWPTGAEATGEYR